MESSLLIRASWFAKVGEMSTRENIQIFHPFDPNAYLRILKAEYRASKHPTQPGCYLIEDLPFYKPRWIEDHVSVLGFNYAPLSDVLIQALVHHPKLVPDEVMIIWVIEQELLFGTTMKTIRKKL
jgi:hypothetical protein